MVLSFTVTSDISPAVEHPIIVDLGYFYLAKVKIHALS